MRTITSSYLFLSQFVLVSGREYSTNDQRFFYSNRSLMEFSHMSQNCLSIEKLGLFWQSLWLFINKRSFSSLLPSWMRCNLLNNIHILACSIYIDFTLLYRGMYTRDPMNMASASEGEACGCVFSRGIISFKNINNIIMIKWWCLLIV